MLKIFFFQLLATMIWGDYNSPGPSYLIVHHVFLKETPNELLKFKLEQVKEVRYGKATIMDSITILSEKKCFK
jgi:hypothetical protein